MEATPRIPWDRPHFLWSILIIGSSLALAYASARNYAGGWNDGSRLATVESLVDYGTLAIDDSIFVKVPLTPAGDHVPYAANSRFATQGTLDKLYIDGHFYSDKSPVPALAMAVLYKGLQTVAGISARDRPDRFIFWMTFITAGLAYVVAVWCVYRVGAPLGLKHRYRLLLTASFALATVSLPYARHVNNHILLLGVTAPLMLGLQRVTESTSRGAIPWLWLLAIGFLAGLGYGIDLGAGPPLLGCVGLLVLYRCRSLKAGVAFACAAVPWLALHHGVNYYVGGTWKPANAVPEYFLWPGCPFDRSNMTGVWNHSGGGHFLTYAIALLAGKRGFLGHNLPLFLAVPGIFLLIRQRPREFPELVFAVFWCGGTWLAYALTSTNYSGQCLTIRWFVPLLAPGFYVLAVLLRENPKLLVDFAILSGWGAFLDALMCPSGPWAEHMVPLFWPIQGCCLFCWLSWTMRRRREKRPRMRVAALANEGQKAA